MNKLIRYKDFLVLIITATVFLLLHFLSDVSWKSIGLILLFSVVAVFVVIGLRMIVYSYIHPSDWLFEHRAHVEGFIQGVMLFIIMIGVHLGDLSNLDAGFLVIAFMVSMILGIIFLGRYYSKKIQKFEDIDFPEYGDSLFVEKTRYQIRNKGPIPRLVFLTNSRLIFWSAQTNEVLQAPLLSELHPALKRSTILSRPKGIQLPELDGSIDVKFPLYWLEKMRDFSSQTS